MVLSKTFHMENVLDWPEFGHLLPPEQLTYGHWVYKCTGWSKTSNIKKQLIITAWNLQHILNSISSDLTFFLK